VEAFFTKAEFYEKAIEILNKQKNIAESTLYDYSMVSLIVVSTCYVDNLFRNHNIRSTGSYPKIRIDISPSTSSSVSSVSLFLTCLGTRNSSSAERNLSKDQMSKTDSSNISPML
jgi:hypothetical protein